MSTFTSTLPDDLLNALSEKAKSLALPKNKIIERALRLYLNHLTRAEYIKSYKNIASDNELLDIAEEGMADYLKEIEK